MSSAQKTWLFVGAVVVLGYWFLIRPKQQAQKQMAAQQQQLQAEAEQMAEMQQSEQMATSAYTGYGQSTANDVSPLFILGNSGPESASYNGEAIAGPGSGLPAALSPLQSSGTVANTI